MNNSRNHFYLVLILIVLGISTLACGYLRFGVVEPTADENIQQPEESQDIQAEGTEEIQGQTQEEDLPQPLPVVAWLGSISSLPENSQFDDFVSLSPQGTGEFGLVGTTSELEAEIRSLRDATGPQEYIHFWGNLVCDGSDYNGCQLRVDRMQYGANYSEEEISDWVGRIKGSTFNSATSYVFELDGEYPMWYSIYSSQNEGLRAEIERLRDTGALVSVSGKLLVGIPDVNGTRIEVSSLEVLSEGNQTQPEITAGYDPTEGWASFQNERYQYQIKYPPDATLEFFGPLSVPTDEIPEGMDVDSYLADLTKLYTDRLCVGIKYSLGVIYISAPPNQDHGYTPCGPTGIGAGEIFDSEGLITIDGQSYQVRTMEILLANGGDQQESLVYHSEMNRLLLDDNTRIFFGSIPRDDATYQDYLAKTREILLQILATYQKY
jgi:hypothetical protein